MKKKSKPIISKIEINEDTSEPSIIQMPLEKAETDYQNLDKNHHIKNEDIEDRKTIGKQMVMRNIFGVDPEKQYSSKRQKAFKHLMTLLFVVIVVGILVWTAYNDFFSTDAVNELSWHQIIETLGANWYYFFFAILCVILTILFKGVKLSILCKSMTGKFRFKTCIETGIIGQYYNNITPLAAGGQPFEIYHLSKHGVHGGEASSLPIAAYFTYQIGVTILAIFSAICFLPSANLLQLPSEIIESTTATVLRPLAYLGIVFGILMPLIVILFCILPKLGCKIVKWVVGIGGRIKIIKDPETLANKTIATVEQNSVCLKKMAKQPFIFIITVLISMAEYLALCSIAYFTLRSFGFDFPTWSIWEWSQIVLVCIVLYSAISFIPTPGNSGAADLSFYWLFKIGLFSVAGLSFPAMIIWRLLSYYSFIILGFAFTTIKRKNDRKKERLGIPLYKD